LARKDSFFSEYTLFRSAFSSFSLDWSRSRMLLTVLQVPIPNDSAIQASVSPRSDLKSWIATFRGSLVVPRLEARRSTSLIPYSLQTACTMSLKDGARNRDSGISPCSFSQKNPALMLTRNSLLPSTTGSIPSYSVTPDMIDTCQGVKAVRLPSFSLGCKKELSMNFLQAADRGGIF